MKLEELGIDLTPVPRTFEEVSKEATRHRHAFMHTLYHAGGSMQQTALLNALMVNHGMGIIASLNAATALYAVRLVDFDFVTMTYSLTGDWE